jgi:hypothetical protein
MGNFVCTAYDRTTPGFNIQTIQPSTILMLEESSLNANIFSEGACIPPHNANELAISAPTLLEVRQTLSGCPIAHFNPAIDAPTQLAIHQMKRNNQFTPPP